MRFLLLTEVQLELLCISANCRRNLLHISYTIASCASRWWCIYKLVDHHQCNLHPYNSLLQCTAWGRLMISVICAAIILPPFTSPISDPCLLTCTCRIHPCTLHLTYWTIKPLHTAPLHNVCCTLHNTHCVVHTAHCNLHIMSIHPSTLHTPHILTQISFSRPHLQTPATAADVDDFSASGSLWYYNW